MQALCGKVWGGGRPTGDGTTMCTSLADLRVWVVAVRRSSYAEQCAEERRHDTPVGSVRVIALLQWPTLGTHRSCLSSEATMYGRAVRGPLRAVRLVAGCRSHVAARPRSGRASTRQHGRPSPGNLAAQTPRRQTFNLGHTAAARAPMRTTPLADRRRCRHAVDPRAA